MVLRKGVTLIEVTIVVTILVLLMVAAIAGLNPIYQMKKGHDATRKKDLKRISIAFEEYFNDKGCYPTQVLIDGLTCKSHDFYQLNPWPCDPNGSEYNVVVDPSESDCPTGFTVTTKLETEETGMECNYGVSSTNKDWRFETCALTEVQTPVRVDPTNTPTPTLTPTPVIDFCCDTSSCNSDADGSCDSTGSCDGPNCFYRATDRCPGFMGNPCLPICQTNSCE